MGGEHVCRGCGAYVGARHAPTCERWPGTVREEDAVHEPVLAPVAAATASPEPNYVHRARVARADEIPRKVGEPIHDGDSFWMVLDLGTYAGTVKIPVVVDVRLKGIDTYELADADGRGVAAREATSALLGAASQIRVGTEKPPPVTGSLGATLGRTLARVWVDGQDLAELLRAGGHAKPVEHLGASS